MREEALLGEVAALRTDVSNALSTLQQSAGSATPELAPVLSSINSSLEALRKQVCTCFFSCKVSFEDHLLTLTHGMWAAWQVEAPSPSNEASDEQTKSLSGALQPIQAALAELQRSQASLQQVMEGSSGTSPNAVVSTGEYLLLPPGFPRHILRCAGDYMLYGEPIMSTLFHLCSEVSRGCAELLESAARRAAKEVLKDFSAQTPDSAELRNAISATLDAVRQLEAATVERINFLVASIGTSPRGPLPQGGFGKL